MYNYYDDIPYGYDRLCSTICTVEGYPSWILDMQGDSVEHKPILFESKYSSLNDLDPTPVHLGYTNYKKKAYYLSRAPYRQWKQGLRAENIIELACEGWPLNVGAWLYTQEFVNTYLNIYPSLSKANEMIDTCTSVAFHKEYALKKIKDKLVIERTGVHVGTYNINKVFNGDVTLLPQYTFLEEEIEEIFNETA